MRAVTVETFGEPDVLRVTAVPVPEPGDGEILIRVRAATVNPVDIGIRAGFFAGMLPKRPWYGLGWDVAGTVERLGPGVTGFAAGAGDEAFLRGFGAEFAPRSDAPADAITAAAGGRVDGVLDAAIVGAPVLAAIKDGGRYAGVRPGGEPEAERGIAITTVGVRSDAARLTELAGLAERGELTLRVAETFDFAAAAEAHARFTKGGLRGRVVLVPRPFGLSTVVGP